MRATSGRLARPPAWLTYVNFFSLLLLSLSILALSARWRAQLASHEVHTQPRDSASCRLPNKATRRPFSLARGCANSVKLPLRRRGNCTIDCIGGRPAGREERKGIKSIVFTTTALRQSNWLAGWLAGWQASWLPSERALRAASAKFWARSAINLLFSFLLRSPLRAHLEPAQSANCAPPASPRKWPKPKGGQRTSGPTLARSLGQQAGQQLAEQLRARKLILRGSSCATWQASWPSRTEPSRAERHFASCRTRAQV